MVGRLLAIVIAIPLLAFAALPDTFTQMLGGGVLSPLARLEVPVAQSAGGYQPGVYAYDDYGFEDPSVYTFLNGGTFNRSWRSAQDGKWGYTDPAVTPPFGSFEYYVRRIAGSKDGTGGQTRPDGKKMKMMLAISQHDLTAQHVDQWGNVQGDETPDWVYAQYGVPKIIFTTTSDGKQWQFPKWTDGIDANGNIVGPTTYLSAVERMVQDFAKDYNGDPRIEGIWVGIGGHGEGWPYPWIIDQQMTNYGTQVGQMFIDQGVTPKAWATFVSRTIAIYKKYFTQTQLFYSGAKHPRSDWGTYRAMNDDAVKQGMNLAAHYLSASPESAYFAYPGFSGWFERWSHVRDYVQDAVGIPEPKKLWSESGANGNIFNPATSERYSYWEALMALDKRVTYLGLYNVQSQNPNLAPVYNMVDEYAGKTLSNTPGVWVAFRKENPGMYDPQADGTYQITINSPAGSNTRTVTIYANYGEWLTQYNPDGTTVPLWDIGGKEGMFARRTDLASGKDSFYLNVDDGYIGPTVGARFNTSASGQPTRIKITYLDSGTSRFEVRYDAFGNANKLAGTVTKANTGAWKTATFDVNDAYFGGRMLGGSDIRILAVSGDVTLHMVEIRTLSAGSAVTPTPTPVHSATATPTQIPATPTPKQIPPTATPTQLPTSTPVPTSVPTATPTPAANPASPTWKGEYYANATLSGTPALVRNDAAINFDWGNGPAAPGLPADNFSARWTSTQQFNAGLYRFHTMADDGIRLWVDGKLVVDDWSNHSARERTGDITLAAGAHSIKVEYYDWVIAAVAKTWWEAITPPTPTATPTPAANPASPTWKGEYYANNILYGNPALVRNDASINFNWGTGSPAPGIPATNFSVRWTSTQQFNAGLYRFHTISDDGIRLWVDGKLVIDDWSPQPATERTGDITLAAGAHNIKVEYFQGDWFAVAKTWWEAITPPTPTATPAPVLAPAPWKGEYYANIALSGTPALVRNDAAINFDWGNGPAAPGLPADNFSARWTSTQQFNAGLYRFHTMADDGIRLWVDGKLVVDDWSNHSARERTGDITLAAGAHSIKVEYYDWVIAAVAKTWWEKLQ